MKFVNATWDYIKDFDVLNKNLHLDCSYLLWF